MKQSLLLYSKHTFETRGAKAPCLIAFGSECYREQKFQGAKVPGSESSIYGTFALGSESTWERSSSYPLTNRCNNRRRVLMGVRCSTGSYVMLSWMWFSQAIRHIHYRWLYSVSQKVSLKVLSLSLPNIDRFSKIFHLHIMRKICNNVITKYTTTH